MLNITNKQDYPMRDFVRDFIIDGSRGIGKFFKGAIDINLAPYFITTAYRKSELKGRQNLENDEVYGAGIGVGYLLGYTAQLLTYGYMTFGRKHPEILLLPALTNIVSAGYEITREKIIHTIEGLNKKKEDSDLVKKLIDNTK